MSKFISFPGCLFVRVSAAARIDCIENWQIVLADFLREHFTKRVIFGEKEAQTVKQRMRKLAVNMNGKRE